MPAGRDRQARFACVNDSFLGDLSNLYIRHQAVGNCVTDYILGYLFTQLSKDQPEKSFKTGML
jgi:hypothetical protein